MQFGPKVNNVDRSGLVSMARTVNALRNINFDVTQFKVTNPGNGIYISLVNSTTADSYPWSKVLFGYTISGNVFTAMAGEIHFKTTIYPVAQTALTIASDLTYVYVEMEWGTGITSIKQSTAIADATTSNQYYRKWLYLLNYTAPSSVSIKTYGWVGGSIDLMPIFG